MTNRRVLLLPLLLAACAAPQESALDNTAWRIARIDGNPAVSDEARLAFAGRNLSASAGCNHMGGAWRTDAGRLIAEQLARTEMWCENARLMDQEQALASLLSAAPEYALEGDRLVLRSGGHVAELKRQP